MRELYLSNERYLAFLKRVKAQIENGLKLEYIDSTDIGNKYTHCSWGQCSCSRVQWPDKEDYLFKRDYEETEYQKEIGIESPKSNISIKYHKENQLCPFDKRESGSPDGCFYHCRIFQNNLSSREEALQLYDIRIEKSNEHE